MLHLSHLLRAQKLLQDSLLSVVIRQVLRIVMRPFA